MKEFASLVKLAASLLASRVSVFEEAKEIVENHTKTLILSFRQKPLLLYKNYCSFTPSICWGNCSIKA